MVKTTRSDQNKLPAFSLGFLFTVVVSAFPEILEALSRKGAQEMHRDN
jgi:hypothetical protein